MIKYRKIMEYISAIGGYFLVKTVKLDKITDFEIFGETGAIPNGTWQIFLIAHPIEGKLLKIHPDEELIDSHGLQGSANDE